MNIFNFQILTTVLTVITYPYSVYILSVERHKLLPSIPTRGHGIVLLGFWTLAFVTENLMFVNIYKSEWWFKYDT